MSCHVTAVMRQVSRTMEYAYNDFVVAQLALLLGGIERREDSERLLRNSENYRMVIDDAGGWVMK